MIILKGSTKKGQEILHKFESLKGTEMYHVYTNISDTFKSAWDKRRKEFYNDVLENEGNGWHVSTHNSSYSWSCGWWLQYKGHNAIKYVTRDNIYVVDLEV